MTSESSGQDLSKPDYPVIFIHGLTSNADKAWCDLRKYLVGQGWTWGETPTYEPDDGDVIGMAENPDADFYTMNMSDWRAEFPSQNLTLSEQGGQVAAVINRVLEVTGKEKVILVGHSMGGLAARNYIQGFAELEGQTIAYARNVATLITVNTPHNGAELAAVCGTLLLCSLVKLNSSSTAVYELVPGSAALDQLNGTAAETLPEDISYYSLIDGGIVILPFFQYGDGIVWSHSQDLGNIDGVEKLNHVAINLDVKASVDQVRDCFYTALGITHLCVTKLPAVWSHILHAIGVANISGGTQQESAQVSFTATPDPVQAGQRVHYTVHVTNPGSASLSDVELSVLLPDHIDGLYDYDVEADCLGSGTGYCSAGETLQWELGTLAAGESRVVSYALEVYRLAPAGAVLHSRATVSASGTGDKTTTSEVRVVAEPGLSVSVAADRERAAPGELVTYTVAYGNAGTEAVSGVELWVSLPAGARFVAASGGGRLEGSNVVWELASLMAGESGQRALLIRAGAASSLSVIRNGSVRLHHGDRVVGSARIGLVTAATPVNLVFETNTVTAQPSGQVSYTVHVTNPEAADLTNVKLSVLLPDHIDGLYDYEVGADCLGSGTGYCSAGETLQWELGTIAAGESRVVSYALDVYRQAPAGIVLHSRATISATEVSDMTASSAVMLVADQPPGPRIDRVRPEPVVGSAVPQRFTVYGSGFDSGSSVSLYDLRTAEVFTDRPVSSASSSQIVINPIFTVSEAVWAVEVTDAAGTPSGFYLFDVVAPDTDQPPETDGFDYVTGDRDALTAANDGDGWYVAQAFGEANDDYEGKYHLGEDWNAESGGNTDCGRAVFASSAGSVVYAGHAGDDWGNVLILRHQMKDGSHVETLYGHLNTLFYTAGTAVNRGDIVGTIGDADGLYSCHLHLEVRQPDNPFWGQPGPGYAYDTTGWVAPSEFIDAHRPVGVKVESVMSEQPESFALGQNYPNPFNPVTTIPYEVAQAGPVTLTVYDVLGRQVLTLVDAYHMPGRYAVRFDARSLPSGPYLYRLQAGSYTETRPLMLLK